MRIELGKLLENFKTNILGAMGSQLDVLQDNKRQEEKFAAMSILCPICRTKNPQREFPLNNISVCHIYMDDHTTKNCPSMLGLQAIYKSGDIGETSRRPPWKPRDQTPYQNSSPQPPPYYHPYQPPQQWNTSSWQHWTPQYSPPPHFTQYECWPQGWRG